MTTEQINQALAEVELQLHTPISGIATLSQEDVAEVAFSALNVTALQNAIIAGGPANFLLMLPKILCFTLYVGRRLEQNEMLAMLEKEVERRADPI